MRDFLAARFIFDGAGNGFGGQQFIEQILTGRQTWPNGSQALTREMHTCDASQFLGDNFIRAVLIRHAAQRDGRGETHKAVAPQP
ncbi:hypothetical protein D3C87_2098950 [compost metagenome]